MFKVDKHPRRELVIAGKHAGKEVTIVPNAEPIYEKLKTLANNNNHWARLTIQGIHDLASGRLHQNNIFVKPNHLGNGGYEEFVIYLPGCKVFAEKLPSDKFKILGFEPDVHFFELRERDGKAGLYSAEHDGNKWNTDFVSSGRVKNVQKHIVGISDSGFNEPKLAAKNIADDLPNTPFTDDLGIEKSGFSLHFTPGEKRLGGLRNFKKAIKPLDNTAIHDSALLLAKTMYDAKSIDDVHWISTFGGSAILTQAMRMLAGRKIKLNKHRVFLYRPSTSTNEAFKWANAIELGIGRDFSKSGTLDYIGNRDRLELIINRRKNDRRYGNNQAVGDSVKYATSLQGGTATLITTAGLLAATAGVAASTPAALSFLAVFATGAAKAAGTAKLGHDLAEAAFPRLHSHIKGKF
jgi:hypothetical protein